MTWNPGAERLFGYTAEEVVGRPARLLIEPDAVRAPSTIMDIIPDQAERNIHLKAVTTGLTGHGNRPGLMVAIAEAGRLDGRDLEAA